MKSWLIASLLALSLSACLNGFVAAKSFWRNSNGNAITNCQGDPIHLNQRWKYQRFSQQDANGNIHIRCPEGKQVVELYD